MSSVSPKKLFITVWGELMNLSAIKIGKVMGVIGEILYVKLYFICLFYTSHVFQKSIYHKLAALL